MSAHLLAKNLWADVKAKAAARMQNMAVGSADRHEGVFWLDRREVTEHLSLALEDHEAETQMYVTARVLLAMVREADDAARDALFEAVASGQGDDDSHLGLCFVMHVMENRQIERYDTALARLERIIPIQRGDPNIARFKIQLNDLIQGTDRYERMKRYLAGKVCAVPFKHFETTFVGGVYLCCSGWLSRSVGDMNSAVSVKGQIFYSAPAQQIRSSIVDGNYRYCNWLSCPRINSMDLNETLDPAQGEMVAKPLDFFLSHDYTCNLSCPSCRKQVWSIGEDLRQKLDDQYIPKLRPFFAEAEVIKVTGSGDPFSSKHFRKLIESLDHKKRNLHLHTNATLFTPKAFADLELSGRIKTVEISIDASKEETYRIVRRGGDFNVLLENLEYVARLRREGEIPYLQFDFVVQLLNYREMPEFVRLARRFNGDNVCFTALRNWGTFTTDEFVHHNVCSIHHPEFPALEAVLNDETLFDPIVDIGSLAFLRRPADSSAGATVG